jgi:DUF1365 family protein
VDGRERVGPHAGVAPRVAAGLGGVNSLYPGRVNHTRVRPRRHALSYRIFMLRLDIDDLDGETGGLRLLSHNRFNLLSVHDADHGDGSATPLHQQVRARLAQAGLAHAGARIEALLMPRILGRGFNPLTVYFCRDAADDLAAILYEVHNTFGERHSYMIAAEPAPGAVRQSAPKRFHVSPFMDMDLDYRFEVTPPAEGVAIRIAVSDAQGPMLMASFVGEGEAMTDASLLRAWLAHPWQTVGVLAAIHWEALKIFAKGLGYRRRPPPPAAAVTMGVESKTGAALWAAPAEVRFADCLGASAGGTADGPERAGARWIPSCGGR